MKLRRSLVGISIASLALVGWCAVPASAGVQSPRDMLAAPSSSPVGTTVNISNAANSPCGGAQGDAPAETLLTVTKPDGVTVTDATALSSSAGDWSYAYTGTDQVGT
ncbi:MAG TPA: hypothetical protein VF320_10475, partial [Acidimicrobiales bacterium]